MERNAMFYLFARFDLPRLFYRFLGLGNVVLKIKEIHNSMVKMATAPLFSVVASSAEQIRS
jgi:rRNA pseudouridine-1189 N-methylase Emg1 (Nep1/Mra1 family)